MFTITVETTNYVDNLLSMNEHFGTFDFGSFTTFVNEYFQELDYFDLEFFKNFYNLVNSGSDLTLFINEIDNLTLNDKKALSTIALGFSLHNSGQNIFKYVPTPSEEYSLIVMLGEE